MWSATVDIPKGTNTEAIEALIEDTEVMATETAPEMSTPEYAGDELRAAVGTAKKAATALITSGAYGAPGDYGWRIELRGHTNPKHESGAPHYTNDYALVSVHQVTETEGE